MNNDIIFRRASAKELIAYAKQIGDAKFYDWSDGNYKRRMQLAVEAGTLGGIICALVDEIENLRSRNHDMQMTIDRFISIR